MDFTDAAGVVLTSSHVRICKSLDKQSMVLVMVLIILHLNLAVTGFSFRMTVEKAVHPMCHDRCLTIQDRVFRLLVQAKLQNLKR